MATPEWGTNPTVSRMLEAYRKRETTPEETIREIIRRAERDADMNIWITPPAMERIRPYLDRLADMRMEEAPLWGIPFAIKDNIDWAGVPTTAGCPDYEYVPEEHATVVARLIQAGAIPIGKTNLDQFATGLVGVRSPYGETRNALDDELISGGSSSGSAVAVARGHAVFALGTDTAGSGRVPAALNGIIGYKPSRGAWPNKGVVPASASLDCVSVFANAWDDAIAVDRVVRGPDAGDAWSRELPPAAPKPPRKLLLPDGPLSWFGPYAQAYERAWHAAVERLVRSGIPVEYADIELFLRAGRLLYGGAYVAERWAGVGGFVEAHPGSALPVIERVLRSGVTAGYDAASVFKAMHLLQSLKREAAALLEDAVLALPTTGGTWTRDQVRGDPIETNAAMGLYANHCNLLDLCAASVPMGEADGLPFGITLFASAGCEHLLAGAANVLSGTSAPASASVGTASGRTLVAVCGLHMRGYPLEAQMRQHGATFVREDKTAGKYALYKLPTVPPKPGLVRREQGGRAIDLEIWEMPLDSFGSFAAGIPGPLCIGKVELQDGTVVPGFVCEAYAAANAEDVTACGGWRGVR